MPRIILTCCGLLLAFVPVGARAALDDLLGKYSTTQDFCKRPEMRVFEIRRGIVEGPDVFCILGATKETEIGTEAYEANCRRPGVIGTLTFDLSKKPERIRIMLPESQDWLTLYVCESGGN
jgi:hypothetical protein